jgi:cytochrome c oxidase subunit 3/cytochrome o ubiquinol oxidase subunit 3
VAEKEARSASEGIQEAPGASAGIQQGIEPGGGAALRLPVPPPIEPEQWLSPAQWGMVAFLTSEVAFFSTLIATYVSFLGRPQSGPTPADLSLPLVIGTTICLLASSGTIHLAERALRGGARAGFVGWWSATIALGVVFLAGTAYEWRGLIVEHDLTISRNVFGSAYYTLVGFHALHVTAGVITLLVVLGLVVSGRVTMNHPVPAELTAWYWHFVDGVWVVVFTVVYVVGR